MLWTDVMLIDDNLDVIAEDVLDSVERTLGCKLPTDYRAVMTTFGVGTYGGFINFFHPSDIAKQTKRSREIWAQQPEFFWPQSDSVLPMDLAPQSIVLSTTLDDDEIVFCSPAQGRPIAVGLPHWRSATTNGLFVLPRHDEVIYTMPRGFDDPLVWDGAPANNEPDTHHFRYFVPWRDRGHVELFTQRTDLMINSVYRPVLLHLQRGAEPAPRIEHDGGMVVFFKHEKAMAYLRTAGDDDRRISVRIEYSVTQAGAVGTLIEELVSIGFDEIGRFAPWTPRGSGT